MKNINILFVGGSKRYSFAEKLIEAGKEFGLTIKIYSYEMGEDLPIADIATVIQGKFFSSAEISWSLINIRSILQFHFMIKQYIY